jgi:hypothetical protein
MRYELASHEDATDAIARARACLLAASAMAEVGVNDGFVGEVANVGIEALDAAERALAAPPDDSPTLELET